MLVFGMKNKSARGIIYFHLTMRVSLRILYPAMKLSIRMPRHLCTFHETFFEVVHRFHEIGRLIVFFPESFLFAIDYRPSYMNATMNPRTL